MKALRWLSAVSLLGASGTMVPARRVPPGSGNGRVPGVPAGPPAAKVLLAIAKSGLASQIGRGENSGQLLHHVAAVRQLVPLGRVRWHLCGQPGSHTAGRLETPQPAGRGAGAGGSLAPYPGRGSNCNRQLKTFCSRCRAVSPLPGRNCARSEAHRCAATCCDATFAHPAVAPA